MNRASTVPPTMVAAISFFVVTAAPSACKPTVGQPPYLVTDTTLLAVYGEPPELGPNGSATYSFLLASPSGTVGDVEALWSICQTPKPPSESNAVASSCAQPPDAGATSAGQTFTAPMPATACQLFGPLAPPPVAGQPAIRPRDPDNTGGYYLPVQLWLPTLPSGPASGFTFERITCNLANASTSAIAEFNRRYQPNKTPGIDRTSVVVADGEMLPLDQVTQAVHAGSSVLIEAAVAPGAAEVFPVYDVVTETVVDQQESLHMSWFVTAGTFEHDRTGIASGEAATSTSNRWTAPASPVGIVYLWLVLRDSRGGVATKSYEVEVVP